MYVSSKPGGKSSVGDHRKVYGIDRQIVVTTLVSSVTVSTSHQRSPQGQFRPSSFLSLLPFILLWPLHVYHQKHPVNLIVLGLFTVSISLPVAVTCANTEGRIVLEALILTSAVVCSLTGYTFWASKKGKDFSFLGPILFTSLIILILTSFMQMFFPLGSTTVAVYGGISALVFCGYIVYDTDNLIKRFTYDEYILASVALYLDILNLFISILRVLRSADG
ncbi:BI1-like protein [Pistacia vera]|uniref:BI1-like protein n=1 Tax=Pistacia vera TaxID=55513 RepID=UPI001262CBA7|nr:BI1-like protein [Pistacia vera]